MENTHIQNICLIRLQLMHPPRVSPHSSAGRRTLRRLRINTETQTLSGLLSSQADVGHLSTQPAPLLLISEEGQCPLTTHAAAEEAAGACRDVLRLPLT